MLRGIEDRLTLVEEWVGKEEVELFLRKIFIEKGRKVMGRGKMV